MIIFFKIANISFILVDANKYSLYLLMLNLFKKITIKEIWKILNLRGKQIFSYGLAQCFAKCTLFFLYLRQKRLDPKISKDVFVFIILTCRSSQIWGGQGDTKNISQRRLYVCVYARMCMNMCALSLRGWYCI